MVVRGVEAHVGNVRATLAFCKSLRLVDQAKTAICIPKYTTDDDWREDGDEQQHSTAVAAYLLPECGMKSSCICSESPNDRMTMRTDMAQKLKAHASYRAAYTGGSSLNTVLADFTSTR